MKRTVAVVLTLFSLLAVRLSAIRRCGKRSFYTHVRLTLRSGNLLYARFLRLSYKPAPSSQ